MEHDRAMNQPLVRSGVAVKRCRRVAEAILDRAGDPGGDVLLELGHRDEQIGLLEALIEVKRWIHVAAPGHLQPAVAAERAATACVLKADAMLAGRLDGFYIPAGLGEHLLE